MAKLPDFRTTTQLSAARMEGDRILADKRRQEQIARERQAIEKAKDEIATEVRDELDDEIDALKEGIDRLKETWPKGIRAGGGGRRTIARVLERDFPELLHAPSYPTRAAAEAARIHVHTTAFRTLGYATPGDGGGALYSRGVASTPGGFQSNDGAWWDLAEEVPTILQFGGDRTGTTDATALFASMLSAFDTIKAPTGIWKVSEIVLTDGQRLLTEGMETIFQQITGVVGTRVISIEGSDVVLESCTIRGNIATDTDEQNHGVFIRGAADIESIVIGDILGENLRGDVVYVGGLPTAKVTGVTIGNIVANNVYRNGVSVTGGEQVSIKRITGSAVGYFMFDAEPNVNSQKIDGIHVESIRGSFVGVVGLLGQQATRVGNVSFGTLDLSPNNTTDSTPGYAPRSFIDDDGLTLRNCDSVKIAMFKARDFPRAVGWVTTNNGEFGCGNLDIGSLDVENCSTVDATYRSLFVLGSGIRKFRIGGGYARLFSSSHRVAFGEGSVNSLEFINSQVLIENFECDGRIGYGLFGARISGCKVHPAAGRVLNTIRVASTANVDIATLNAGDTIDGVVLVNNDVVLLKNQTAPAENGYYKVAVAAPAPRWVPGGDAGSDFPGSYAYVREGTTNARKFFKNDNVTDPTLGTDAITFSEAVPYDAYMFDNSRNVLIEGCDFTLGRAGIDCTNFTIVASKWRTTHASIVWAQSVLSDGALHYLVNTTFNTVFYEAGQYNGQQTLNTNVDFTISQASPEETLHTGTLTAARTVTLSTTGAYEGLRRRITRTGLGAFNLNIGAGTALTALAPGEWAEVVYDGSAWKLAARGIVPVAEPVCRAELFGCIGDGSTNNATTLGAAIATAAALGKPLLIGPGTFVVNVADPAFALSDYQVIEGAGIGRTIIEFRGLSSSSMGFTATQKKNIAIRNLTIKHNTALTGNQNAVNFVDCNDCLVENVEQLNFSSGFVFTSPSAPGVTPTWGNRNRAVNCVSSAARAYGFMSNAQNGTVWQGCEAYGSTNLDGFKTGVGNRAHRIVGCYSHHNNADGFDTYDGFIMSTMSDCVAEVNGAAGYQVKGTLGGTYTAGDYVSRDSVISNCIARGNLNNGFLFQEVRNLAISNCMAVENTNFGFAFNNVQGLIVTGIHALRNTQDGVNILGNSSRNRFVGVIVEDNSYVDGVVQNGTYHGINIASGSTNFFSEINAFIGTQAGKLGGQGYGIYTGTSTGNVFSNYWCSANVTGAVGGTTPYTSNSFGDEHGGLKIRRGTGSPEGVVTGAVGDVFLRTDGGAVTTFYIKESGTGNTGWVAK